MDNIDHKTDKRGKARAEEEREFFPRTAKFWDQ